MLSVLIINDTRGLRGRRDYAAGRAARSIAGLLQGGWQMAGMTR
jgi:hypothetical protein